MIYPNKGNITPNKNCGKQLKKLISSNLTRDIIHDQKYKVLQREVVEKFISKNAVTPREIQSTLDTLGVSKRGYSTIQKTILSILQRKGVKSKILPTLDRVWKERSQINEEQFDFIGNPFHIERIYHGNGYTFTYNEFNNIFMDLLKLQTRMVEFPNVSVWEVSRVFYFVIKLDECEILKENMVNCVTITLMNRGLSKFTKDNPSYFNVQSKIDIWWLGAFEVTHLILFLTLSSF